MHVQLDIAIMLMEQMTLLTILLFVIAFFILLLFFFFFFWFLVLRFIRLGLGLRVERVLGSFLGGLLIGRGGCDVAAVHDPVASADRALSSVFERSDVPIPGGSVPATRRAF